MMQLDPAEIRNAIESGLGREIYANFEESVNGFTFSIVTKWKDNNGKRVFFTREFSRQMIFNVRPEDIVEQFCFEALSYLDETKSVVFKQMQEEAGEPMMLEYSDPITNRRGYIKPPYSVFYPSDKSKNKPSKDSDRAIII